MDANHIIDIEHDQSESIPYSTNVSADENANLPPKLNFQQYDIDIHEARDKPNVEITRKDYTPTNLALQQGDRNFRSEKIKWSRQSTRWMESNGINLQAFKSFLDSIISQFPSMAKVLKNVKEEADQIKVGETAKVIQIESKNTSSKVREVLRLVFDQPEGRVIRYICMSYKIEPNGNELENTNTSPQSEVSLESFDLFVQFLIDEGKIKENNGNLKLFDKSHIRFGLPSCNIF